MIKLMQRKVGEVINAEDGALRGVKTSQSNIPWRMILIWFVRPVALLWVMKGLAAWAVILGVWDISDTFSEMPFDAQATIVFFAVIDLIAAVGLWMISAWGGVVWIIAIATQLFLSSFFPRLTNDALWVSAGLGVLLLGYLFLSWMDRRSAAD